LPGGGKEKAKIRVSSIPAFLIIKGFALGDRLKEKDAYDIAYCLRNSAGGLDRIIRDLEPLVGNTLVQESLNILSEKYADTDTVGPVHVANFQEITDADERELVKRDAYERVQALLRGLGKE